MALPLSSVAPRAQTAAPDVTVFAAASLKNVLDDISTQYTEQTGKKVVVSYAGSSALAKQIEQGAPADVFISADLEWMDYLAQKSLIRSDTRVNLLGNHLVLIAPAQSPVTLKIAKGFDLSGAIGESKIAMADVKSVPAGKYGKASLEALGVWAAVENKVAQADNVRAALAFVARGEAALGIVYQTDARAEPKVTIVDVFPDDTHPAIVYPAALTATPRNADDAAGFLKFLESPGARQVFERAGFKALR